jgi:hypothetical protein
MGLAVHLSASSIKLHYRSRSTSSSNISHRIKLWDCPLNGASLHGHHVGIIYVRVAFDDMQRADGLLDYDAM